MKKENCGKEQNTTTCSNKMSDSSGRWEIQTDTNSRNVLLSEAAQRASPVCMSISINTDSGRGKERDNTKIE